MDKLEEIKENYLDKIKSDMNQDFARRVAKNLYNYLDSFNQVNKILYIFYYKIILNNLI